MKYCVLADLKLATPSQGDQVARAVKDRIAGKPVWGKVTIAQGISEDKKPTSIVEVRFDREADMDELFELVKDRMDKIPVLKGKVTKHLCPHDTEPHPPCKIQEEYVKE